MYYSVTPHQKAHFYLGISTSVFGSIPFAIISSSVSFLSTFYILKFSSKNIVVLPVHVVSIQLFQFNT